MFSVTNVLLLMGLVFTIVGGVSHSKVGKTGIKAGSPVENVVLVLILIGILLFIFGLMLKVGDLPNKEYYKESVAKFALPLSLGLSVVLVIMTSVALGNKDLKNIEGTTEQKDAKKNLKIMFGVILGLSLVNVLVIGGVMLKGMPKNTVEGNISSKFGFDFEF